MVYGDSPNQGFIRGRTFSHPKLRFTFRVPAGFVMSNRPTSVLARRPGGGVIRFDSAQRSRTDDPLEHLRSEWAAKANLANVQRLDINGMAAATATTQARTQDGQQDARLVAIRYARGRIYRFLFLTPPGLTRRLQEGLQQTTYSFRRLSDREAAALKPKRLRIVTVRRGDSVDSLAARMAVAEHRTERFRVLNALPANARLSPGERVKIVNER
jgi:predicted Zn-dependent protease